MHCPRCGMDVPRESSFCNHCGSSLLVGVEYPTQELSPQGGQDILSFHPDQSFVNRYRIIEEIGRGGMGRVYKAEDQQLNILVAIKMIHPELLTNPRIIARFKKEILLAREISHENVVRIYDIGEFKGIKFIYSDSEDMP